MTQMLAAAPAAAPALTGYIPYGVGEFDGQGSGHDTFGTLYLPPTGTRNNTDGGRSILFPDYRQA